MEKISLKVQEKEIPSVIDKNTLSAFLLDSFGILSSSSQKEDISILIALIKATKLDKGLTAQELASASGLKISAVYKHINKFLQSGLIYKAKESRYRLKERTLENTIKWRLKPEIDKILDGISVMARELDEELKKE